MKSEEIKKSPYNLDKWGGYANLAMWLKEIAYQLAVMNERPQSQPFDHSNWVAQNNAINRGPR